MIVLNVEQGSEAWLRARLGIPTASNFKRIITPSGTLSGSALRYMDDLVAEWQTGQPGAGCAPETSEWMRRGIELEPEARCCYAAQTGAAVAQVGLVYRDDKRLIAASPDGLVGAEGLLEIKCPKPVTHETYLRAGNLPPRYAPQVQGQLWVTGRQWCDFFSYDPDAARQFLIRVWRDEPYIEKLCAALEGFVAGLLERRHR